MTARTVSGDSDPLVSPHARIYIYDFNDYWDYLQKTRSMYIGVVFPKPHPKKAHPLKQNPDPPPLTSMADLIAAIERSPLLEDIQKREYRGAVRTLCQVLSRRPEAVPASVGEVRALLDEVPLALRQCASKTVRNNMSRVKSALDAVNGVVAGPPRGEPLLPVWQILFDRLDGKGQKALSRFIRYASFKSIKPTMVNDAVMATFVAHLQEINWGRDAGRLWRQTAHAWNDASSRVAAWPSTQLAMPAEAPRHRHHALAAFPVTFQDDLHAYLKWAAAADPFAASAPDRALKPSSLRLQQEYLRLAASTLAGQLGGPEQVPSLAVLVAPNNVRAILTAYLEREGHKVTTFMQGMAKALRRTATQWVKAPAQDLEQLRSVMAKLSKLGAGAPDLTPKNKKAIRQFEDSELQRALFALPELLARRALRPGLPWSRRLQMIQIGVAIETLIAAPMRLQNLCGLRINEHLQWPSGRTGSLFITLTNSETKNETSQDYELKGPAKALIEHYLDDFRRASPLRESPWLFVNPDGSQRSAGTLRDGIKKAIKRELGVELTPHQFRHLSAALILDAHPGGIALVKELLGHKNLKTTMNFYAGMRTRQAGREYDRLLQLKRTGFAQDA